jgi:hypothetical protein
MQHQRTRLFQRLVGHLSQMPLLLVLLCWLPPVLCTMAVVCNGWVANERFVLVGGASCDVAAGIRTAGMQVLATGWMAKLLWLRQQSQCHCQKLAGIRASHSRGLRQTTTPTETVPALPKVLAQVSSPGRLSLGMPRQGQRATDWQRGALRSKLVAMWLLRPGHPPRKTLIHRQAGMQSKALAAP